jgi:putative NADH-flavin reductase
MRIVVFGASGGTGSQAVQQGASAGHLVTAVTRRPHAFAGGALVRNVVVPDLTLPGAIEHVVRDQDAVISALGTDAKGPVSVCTDGIRSILAAMQHTGTRRLIAVSAHGAAETHDRSLYSLAVWATLADKMRDKEAMERLVQDSGVDWTIVRPPALNDKPGQGRYRTGTDLRIRLTSAISRADLGDFLVREAQTPAYLHRFARIAA